MADPIKIPVEADDTKFKKTFKSVGKSIERVERKAKDLEDSFDKLGKISGAALAGIGAGIALAVREASKFERIETQFRVLTGNAQDARKAIQDLQKFSAGTPFQFDEIANAGKQLLGFGFAADELEDKLRAIGDVSAAVGQPIGEIGLIFGQVKSAARLTGERLLQLQERAVPIGDALAKVLDKPKESIRELVSQGQVDFETFEKAFRSLSEEGGLAFEAIERQSQTLGGQISTLKDNISLTANEFGKIFLPQIKAVTSALTDFLQELRNDQDLKDLVKTITLVVGVLASFILTASLAGKAAASLSKTITTLKLAFSLLSGPVGVVIAALGGLAFLISKLSDQTKNYNSELRKNGRELQNVKNQLRTKEKNLKQVTAQLIKQKGSIENLSDAEKGFINKLKEDIARLKEQKTALMEARKEIEKKTEATNKNTEAQRNNTQSTKELSEEEKRILAEKREFEDAIATERLERQKEIREQEFQANVDQEQREKDFKEQLRLEELKKQREADFKRFKEDEKLKERLKNADSDLTRFGIQANEALNDEKVKNTQEALGNLSSLTRSSSRELFELGKAASVANAIINTSEGVTKALAQGGIFGPILGATVAAAGAIQIASISAQKFTPPPKGFAEGGLTQGAFAGGRTDNLLAPVQSGELIAPRSSFDEVVESVARQRGFTQGEEATSDNNMQVTIGFTDNAFEIIETKLNERQSLGFA